jgi:hypothetical protein
VTIQGGSTEALIDICSEHDAGGLFAVVGILEILSALR